ncbi:hypothetical protein [Pseudonocardia pini]|uniref:hypothetical protein n=1 Tax=Pseudonocardia pini TaxID=2758030 RepID=UPI0015F0B1D3|nr:hypothetical protein [Pseudonocardia pini]
MDQEALVESALEDGARLDVELNRRGIMLEAPIVAYDLDAGRWALLFGFSARLSRRQIYEQAQNAIQTLGLRLELDHIVLVKDSDPGIKELRELAGSVRRASWESSTPSVEIAGRQFSSPQVVRVSPLQFEEAVGQALRSVLPSGFRLQRGYEFLPPVSDADMMVRRPRRVIEVDYVAVTDGAIVLVEAKASRKPLLSERVLSALGQLTYFRHELGGGQPVSLVLVSMSDFSGAVRREFEGIEGFVLVAWSVGQDRSVLAEAVARAASSGA